MADPSWFDAARYGLFIHWGPYAVGARGEWLLNRENIPYHEYTEQYVNRFAAERYDPGAWARLARDAGMKYIVLTTRHHDGFCLWNTQTTRFNAVEMGPRRDLLAPFVEACRTEGLRIGFYYSIADWHHPDYPDAYARDWPAEWKDDAQRLRFAQHYRAQVRELMTRYGTIDVLWYDGPFPDPADGGETNRMVKHLQPKILINERLGQTCDFRNSEQALVAKEGPWEACMTLNENWGFHAGDHQWKSAAQVIRMLTTAASQAGNLLLNVGPRADGTIPQESDRILREAGGWLEKRREFLPNSIRSPFSWTSSALLTCRENNVYVHIFHPTGSEFVLAEIANRVLRARLVGAGKELSFQQQPDRLVIHGLPDMPEEQICTTVALDVDGPPRPLRKHTTPWLPG
jgi:alpha-L-fucosidase